MAEKSLENGDSHGHEPESQRGSGSGHENASIRVVLPGKGLKDQRMERRAMRGRWNVPQNLREGLILRQIKLASDPNNSPRDRTQAFRSVLAVDALDLEMEKLAARADKIADGGASGTPKPITLVKVVANSAIAASDCQST